MIGVDNRKGGRRKESHRKQDAGEQKWISKTKPENTKHKIKTRGERLQKKHKGPREGDKTESEMTRRGKKLKHSREL